jgi:diaminopimelate decarboxylase
LCGGRENLTRLAHKYQTPLMVIDRQKVTENIETIKKALSLCKTPSTVVYASKAFLSGEMLNIAKEQNLGLDVVSGGELFLADKYGFDMQKLYFHGNNKSREELTAATDKGVTLIVDNFQELELIKKTAKKPQKIMLRINTGVEANTHKYIATAFADSKFGIRFNSYDFDDCIHLIDTSGGMLVLTGIAGHIGSQIVEAEPFVLNAQILIDIIKSLNRPLSLNIGGGFGIKYFDENADLFGLISKVAEAINERTDKAQGIVKEVIVECGRSIIGDAGVTLYTAGFKKTTPNCKYIFVDGGMTDNIRPALYGAKYRLENLSKIDAKRELFTIGGKLCESGDLLGQAYLPSSTEMGDILACFCTGAYCYPLSSNYNLALKPAVVFWDGKRDYLALRRQTYADLLCLEEKR